jgi:2-methylcitrate dehydratase PrpD
VTSGQHDGRDDLRQQQVDGGSGPAPATASLTGAVAEFIAGAEFADVPASAVSHARDAITDCVGVMFAGADQPVAHKLRGLFGRESGDVRLVGSTQSAARVEAALYHGAIAHALDYDDLSHPSYTHPSCHLLPVLLSLADYAKADGPSAITAYAVGLEIEGKLGRAMNLGHYERGWHSTATLGTMGAAAAGASLLGLDVSRTAIALAIAASSASGLRANFGTMTKPLHAGLAARNGVLAVLLAETGWTATEDILEHPMGFQEVFSGEGGVDAACWSALGSPWEITTEVGLALKLYPSCAATHCAIEAAQELRRTVGDDEIRRVRVGQSELASKILIHPHAPTPLAAKFSMPFCIAAAFVTGDITSATFADQAIWNSEIRALMERVEVVIDDRVRHHPDFGAVVEAEFVSGRREEVLITVPKGTKARWPSRDELSAKFDGCAAPALGSAGVERVFDACQRLPETESLEELTAALTLPAGELLIG